MLHWESGRPGEITGDQLRYSYDNPTGSGQLELDGTGNIISMEEYYPYGGTAVWTARSAVEADYKTIRYSGQERDATGLYYYGYRYYQPWVGRWLSADPAGTVDGLNLYCMVRNNPVTFMDSAGLMPVSAQNQRLKMNDKIYNRLKNITSSAETVNKNLNMGANKIVLRMAGNILSTLISGPINYTMGMTVPAISAAPAALAGLTGTATGDALNTVLQKLSGADLTHTLDMDSRLPLVKNPLRYFAYNNIVPRVKDYGFAMATENSFPYAVSEPLDGSRPQNFVSRNINNASNLIYKREQLAQRAYHETKTLMGEVDRLEKMAFENVGVSPENAHTIAGATMTRSPFPILRTKRMTAEFVLQVRNARSALAELQDEALRIGYPSGWLLKHGESIPVTESKYVPGSIPKMTAITKAKWFLAPNVGQQRSFEALF